MRKHFSQMNSHERQFLIDIIRKTKRWHFTEYSQVRAGERIVTREEVLAALSKGKVVEYRMKGAKHRVLVRGTQVLDGKYVACVVVDIARKRIITVYLNDHSDNHPSLNWSLYSDKLDIIKRLRGLIEWQNLSGTTSSG